MAGLIEKKLSRLPIGTYVELTLQRGAGDTDVVAGHIIDSDFSESLELAREDGGEVLLDYSIVKRVGNVQPIASILASLPAGTSVSFSYGDEGNRTPNPRGVVTENDHAESLELKTENGDEMILSYDIIRSLLVSQDKGKVVVVPPTVTQNPASSGKKTVYNPGSETSETGPATPKQQTMKDQSMTLFPEISSDELKSLYYDEIPRDNRKKLDSAYESYKYGVKNNDRQKQIAAAKTAKRILLTQEANGFIWSPDAYRFCGYLLRSVDLFDAELFLRCGCLLQAADCSYTNAQPALAEACIVKWMLDDNVPEEKQLILLAKCIAEAKDVSALRSYYNARPGKHAGELGRLYRDVLLSLGTLPPAVATLEELLSRLERTYTAQESAQQLQKLTKQKTMKAVASQPDAPAKEPQTPAKEPQIPVEPRKAGSITNIRWSEGCAILSAEEKTYSFRCEDILDPQLRRKVSQCITGMRQLPDGKPVAVVFDLVGGKARNIRPAPSLFEQARAIAANANDPNRYAKALRLCTEAVEMTDDSTAMGDLVRYASALYKSSQDLTILERVIALYESHRDAQTIVSDALMELAFFYHHTGRREQALRLARKACEDKSLQPKARTHLIARYIKLCKEQFDSTEDLKLQKEILLATEAWEKIYRNALWADAPSKNYFESAIRSQRIYAQCSLDMLEEAEAEFAQVSEDSYCWPDLNQLVRETRERLCPDNGEELASQEAEELALERFRDEIEEEEELLPYQDIEGWNALQLTRKDVVDYALSIKGEHRAGAILAYLHAGAMLNPELSKVEHEVALAVNDPIHSSDYSVAELMDVLSNADPDYPELHECCMGAAFLRASFISGRGYDYSVKVIQDSISITKELPSLEEAYNTLEEFRTWSGSAIDIYADYRNQGIRKLEQDMEKLSRYAGELHVKFIQTVPRETVSFGRLVDTKKLLFDKNGYLAQMLSAVMNKNQHYLEQAQEAFVSRFLKAEGSFSAKNIDIGAVAELVDEAWDKAGKNMTIKRGNATLQGTRRNNLYSNITTILEAICRWYALSEQSAGLTWRTDEGNKSYHSLKPKLISQLNQLRTDCLAAMEKSSSPEHETGMFLLAQTAAELAARLEGTWKYGQEQYLYTDFLRSDNVILDERFLPVLNASFCALSEFNILARIRAHVEGEKLSWQEHINRIYGKENVDNNFGTAYQIVEYAHLTGGEEANLPENEAAYVDQAARKMELRCKDFLERYALAKNYGQIMQSDAFSYDLERTVRYWYSVCHKTKNFGFFQSLLLQAEERIHASAKEYEIQLEGQLDKLKDIRRELFTRQSDLEDAIRTQISKQNFIVAEDWMNHIQKEGTPPPDIRKPEAIKYLEQFWANFATVYSRVSDSSRPLSSMLRRWEARNKDTKRAKMMLDCWLSNGRASTPERIQQLLTLLGWTNIRVDSYTLPTDSRMEVYEVTRVVRTIGTTTPMHPIAAFGSDLDRKKMYAVCLYGTYDCKRLLERIRSLDAIDGNKVILLDYFLGGTERRTLAQSLKARERGLRNTYLVIDRVLITHLAEVYNESLINRILMAIAMPFSYCQPYVVESVHTMPPEIFIGRKDELIKIERSDGVNLIYGGRQLGKSALFKKALSDIDGINNQRAVLIDIKDLSCAQSARKLSAKLIDLKITPNAEITEDWDTLCRNIELQLRNPEAGISYLLLMLDEADTFINDCGNCGYRPLVAMKDVQQSLPNQFKFVLAGLHNVVRFNRDVALGRNSVITHLPSLKITPFRAPEAQELLTVPLSYLGFSLPSKETVSQILATANYFPGLIQLYCKKLIESVRDADYAHYDVRKTPPYVVGDKHLRRVMADREFVEQIHEKFEITLKLDQDQGSCYYPLALLIGWLYSQKPSKNGYTALDVLRCARDLGIHPIVDLDEEKTDALLQELRDLNILRNVSSDSYLLASKNFRDLLGSEEEIFEKLAKTGGESQ